MDFYVDTIDICVCRRKVYDKILRTKPAVSVYIYKIAIIGMKKKRTRKQRNVFERSDIIYQDQLPDISLIGRMITKRRQNVTRLTRSKTEK